MSNISTKNDDVHTRDLLKNSVKNMNNNNMIMMYQLLLQHNLQDTAQHLIKEAVRLGYTGSINMTRNTNEQFTESYEELLSTFKSGNCTEFFKMWNYMIPVKMREEKEYKILTLNLHLHFAILPRRMGLLNCHKKKHSESITITMQQDADSNDIEEQSFATEMDENTNEGMKQLLEYLTTDGKELEHELHLRPFFALPYIEDPLAEPILSKIFNNDWVNELTTNLEMFVVKCKQLFSGVPTSDKHVFHGTSANQDTKSADMEGSNSIISRNNTPIIPDDRNIPLFMEDVNIGEQMSCLHKKRLDCLHQRAEKNVQSKYTQTYFSKTDCFETVTTNKQLIQYNQELALMKSHYNNTQRNYKKLNTRFHKLHTDYHKLISVAGELTAALDNSFRGEPVDLQKTLETCITIFPELFSRNIRDDSETLLMTEVNSAEMLINVQLSLDAVPRLPHMLDFKKIKSHLVNGSVKTKLYLLQALRWKLTLTQPAERDEMIHEYITSDLLGLHGQIASDSGKSILPYLLIPENVLIPHPLQQSTMRLLNAFASIRCGRDYLSASPTVVNVVFKCLNTSYENGIDALTWDMMIATLQKLSLRKQQRMYMIEIGIVEWLVYHLHSESRRMSFYRLEYATALLMNLSLHQQAQMRASAIAPIVISTVLGLLSVDNMPALSYVNGALNNFLSNRVINDEAKKMKLSSVLEYYRKQKTGEIRKHLDHILKIHNGECTNNTEDGDTADDDNEDFDVIESQLEEDDPVKNHTGELFGDTLLATYYTALPNASQVGEMTEDTLLSEMKLKSNPDHESTGNSVNDTESTAGKTVERATSSHGTIGQLSDRTESSKLFILNRKSRIENDAEKNDTSHKSNPIKCTHYSEDAVYLYTNDSSEESSKTAMASSSLTLAGASDHFVGPATAEVERFSSIASLNLADDINSGNMVVARKNTELDKEGEDAFLAKPKLSRTPP